MYHVFFLISTFKANGNSKQAPMTTNGKNAPAKLKPNGSPHSKVYESGLIKVLFVIFHMCV
jgi:hypothetical protein